jgi:hypothetical protein
MHSQLNIWSAILSFEGCRVVNDAGGSLLGRRSSSAKAMHSQLNSLRAILAFALQQRDSGRRMLEAGLGLRDWPGQGTGFGGDRGRSPADEVAEVKAANDQPTHDDQRQIRIAEAD